LEDEWLISGIEKHIAGTNACSRKRKEGGGHLLLRKYLKEIETSLRIWE
jgi:hypothetical protein